LGGFIFAGVVARRVQVLNVVGHLDTARKRAG